MGDSYVNTKLNYIEALNNIGISYPISHKQDVRFSIYEDPFDKFIFDSKFKIINDDDFSDDYSDKTTISSNLNSNSIEIEESTSSNIYSSKLDFIEYD